MVGLTGIPAVAGCLTPSSQATSCSDGADFSLDEATETRVSNEFSTPRDGLPYATRTVVSDALAAGEATSRGYYSPSPRTDYVVTGPEPRYYRVETTDHDRAEIIAYEYSIEIGVDESTLSDDKQVRSFTELPTHDRDSIHGAIGNSGLLHAPHYTSFSVVFAYEREESQERSVFVPPADTRYVEWDETVLRFRFDGHRTVGLTSATVATELVAESPDAFVEHIGRERGVVLETLTSRQRDILTRAIEGTYAECPTYSEPFSDLRDQLSMSDGEVAPLVRYDDSWYFTHLSR